MFKAKALYIYHCGDYSGEVPPVLIPNTEVKLTSAENTLLETAREDRSLLHPKSKHPSNDGCFSFCGAIATTYMFTNACVLTRFDKCFLLQQRTTLPYGKKSQLLTIIYY